MIRICLLYRDVKLTLAIKLSQLVCICVTLIASVNAKMTDNLPYDICDGETFHNTYYLLNSGDIPLASDLVLKDTILKPDTDKGLKSNSGKRELITTFYDFNELEILDGKKELKHILNKNLPAYRKEKEQIIYSDFSSTQIDVNAFEVKYYNKKLSVFDKHPLLSLIKRKERPILFNLLSDISQNDISSISESIMVHSIEKVNFIMLYDVKYAAITLSQFTISSFGVANTSFLLKIELLSNQTKNLLREEKEDLYNFLCKTNIVAQTYFPDAEPLSRFAYPEYFKLAENILPSRLLFRQYPILFSIGQIICLSLIGFLFIYLILGRFSKRINYRQITKN